MKIIRKIYCVPFLAILLMSSCSWLDVAPSNEVNEEDLFSEGSGYRNALNGIYLKLAETSLYGSNLSYGFIEVLGHQYILDNLKTTSSYYKAAQFQYDDTDVKSIISNLWTNGYNVIASCNNLIYNVSNADSEIFEGLEMEKNMIWGEALALRALVHFDILRMFAPSMETDDGKAYIPYVDAYPVISTTYYTNAEILEKIETDLTEARKLVATCDVEQHPEWLLSKLRMLGKGTTDELPEDVFYAFRGYRLNYYAITALMARVYMWKKDYKAAFDKAEEVIKASYNDEAYFGFVNSGELDEDMKDSQNLLFALSRTTLLDEYKPFTNSSSDNLFLFSGSDIYGDADDERGSTSLLGTVSGAQYSKKYLIEEGSTGYDMIPMLRLSEIYYMTGEYYARNNNFEEARKALDVVRSSRGIMLNLPTISSLDGFYTELVKEVRKEQMAEGQLYFLYKRLNMKKYFNKDEKDIKFVFDRPDNEDI
ncbi:RagB/SusD family nutrient uptake outer membrane protein [uncultured Bacteroides sp.]|uniref:RagB/SusD family nutrient uptake outer membrane protein n=1 Tax=uncultured Bacteroides sp. TaxID=162156 RepID=UPI002674F062|nr:RagB/SusD family nutrient uptake outer membrane protein [uncultured Bacteroides sp.]